MFSVNMNKDDKLIGKTTEFNYADIFNIYLFIYLVTISTELWELYGDIYHYIYFLEFAKGSV